MTQITVTSKVLKFVMNVIIVTVKILNDCDHLNCKGS